MPACTVTSTGWPPTWEVLGAGDKFFCRLGDQRSSPAAPVRAQRPWLPGAPCADGVHDRRRPRPGWA